VAEVCGVWQLCPSRRNQPLLGAPRHPFDSPRKPWTDRHLSGPQKVQLGTSPLHLREDPKIWGSTWFNQQTPCPICPKDQGHLTHSHRNRTWTVRFGSFSNSRTVASRMLCYTQSAHFVDSTKWASIRRRIQADTPENHGHLKVPKQSLLSLLQVCCAAHREGSWAETLESLCTDCCQRETKKFKEKCSKKFGNEWCSHGYTSVRSLHSRFRDSQILIFDISMQKSHGYHGLWLFWFFAETMVIYFRQVLFRFNWPFILLCTSWPFKLKAMSRVCQGNAHLINLTFNRGFPGHRLENKTQNLKKTAPKFSKQLKTSLLSFPFLLQSLSSLSSRISRHALGGNIPQVREFRAIHAISSVTHAISSVSVS